MGVDIVLMKISLGLDMWKFIEVAGQGETHGV